MKILETERLILREIVETDDEFILDLLNQPSFIKYIGDRNVRNLEESREFIESRFTKGYAENGFGLYLVELKNEFCTLADARVSASEDEFRTLADAWVSAFDDERVSQSEIQNPKSKIRNQAIGICGFVKRDTLPDADIGFAFLPQFEKRGFAFESADAMMKYGREKLNLRKVLAITTQNNESSIKLLEKLGFKLERLIKMPHDDQELNLFSSED